VTWQPADAELDALARTLPVPERGADRIEQERTSILAQAAGAAQRRRSSVVPVVAGIAAAFAAAAAVLVWIIVRPGAPAGPKERITALGPAHFERVTPWPDFVVRIDDGRVAIQVAKLEAGERFRAVTSDAELEVRGTRFTVAAEQGHVATVAVTEGRVEVRYRGEPSVFLAAGETWSPARTVQREVIEPAPPTVVAQTASEPPVPAPAPVRPVTKSPAPGAKHLATAHAETVAPAPIPATTSPTKAVAASPTTSPSKVVAAGSDSAAETRPAVAAARPGEAEFRAGVAALRAGDATAATRSFAVACTAARGEALDEDACFWLGAAAKRAGDTATARDALARFLTAFPASARAGEAAALLGWILYDAGDLDAAKQRFELAAKDRVPKVKESAERGLEAIKRKRAP
jgi:hypothetical protein